MREEYILYPRTITQLAAQIKIICDDYWKNEITFEELKDDINNLNKYKEFIKDKELNTCVRQIIGAKRTRLIMEIFNKN